MDIVTASSDRADDIARLFDTTFTASEGAEEGRLIGTLARDLIATTPAEDLMIFCADEADTLAGCILFTRLRYADPRAVWLLAPVAVAPGFQRQGIGQALIRDGLARVRKAGGEIAVTYGDPVYYSRLGFQPVSTETLPAPLPLTQPHGWQAQSLTESPLSPLAGPARCAPAFDDPAFW